jgi:hypothetical protein
MPRYLVEAYASTGTVEDACARARSAGGMDANVTYLRTTFLPKDEMALHEFDAPSAEALERVGRLAALSFERIVEAIEARVEGPFRRE